MIFTQHCTLKRYTQGFYSRCFYTVTWRILCSFTKVLHGDQQHGDSTTTPRRSQGVALRLALCRGGEECLSHTASTVKPKQSKDGVMLQRQQSTFIFLLGGIAKMKLHDEVMN